MRGAFLFASLKMQTAAVETQVPSMTDSIRTSMKTQEESTSNNHVHYSLQFFLLIDGFDFI